MEDRGLRRGEQQDRRRDPMTECSTEIILFPLPQKPVTIRNDGGALTSDAGVLLLRQLDERLGLPRRLAGWVGDRGGLAGVLADRGGAAGVLSAPPSQTLSPSHRAGCGCHR